MKPLGVSSETSKLGFRAQEWGGGSGGDDGGLGGALGVGGGRGDGDSMKSWMQDTQLGVATTPRTSKLKALSESVRTKVATPFANPIYCAWCDVKTLTLSILSSKCRLSIAPSIQ